METKKNMEKVSETPPNLYYTGRGRGRGGGGQVGSAKRQASGNGRWSRHKTARVRVVVIKQAPAADTELAASRES